MNLIPIFVVGLASSILIELLKLFPQLNENKEIKRVISFIVALVISLFYTTSQIESLAGIEPGVFVIGVLSSTFIVYKSLIQPAKLILRGFKKALNRTGT